MITGKLNLAKLIHVKMEKKGKNGIVKGLFIPIEVNHLYNSEATGNVYLDLVAFGLKDPKDNQTHLVRQSLSKDVREAMSDKEQKSIPIIGSLNNMESSGGSGHTETPNDAGEGKSFTEDDDLPF